MSQDRRLFAERSLSGLTAAPFGARRRLLAVTAGNGATEDQWRPPIAILREVFLASLVD